MRTIPVLVEIAEDISRLAPGCLFFNYSNPMTANCAAISRFTDVAVVGLCHGVFHIQHELAHFIRKPFEETSTLYCGINHLTFIYDFRWQGRDAWPLVRERLAEERKRPYPPDDIGSLVNDGGRASFNPFSWELFDRLGAVTGHDRHTTEFFPELFADGSYYGKTLGVDAFSLRQIIERGEQTYQLMASEAMGESTLDAAIFGRSLGEQEQLIPIIRSVLTDSRYTVSVNVPNTGLVPNLPYGAVLEVPGVATARGIRALSVPDFPSHLAGIIERRLAPVQTTVEAALKGDRGLFAEALLLDGAVAARSQADAMVDDFIIAQRKFLPRFS
jgi:alpha-galactosidase